MILDIFCSSPIPSIPILELVDMSETIIVNDMFIFARFYDHIFKVVSRLTASALTEAYVFSTCDII